MRIAIFTTTFLFPIISVEPDSAIPIANIC